MSKLADQLFAREVKIQIDNKVQEWDDVVFDSSHSQAYNINYTCLIIPRFPNHQLKGDIADLIPHSLQNICISYGWRLDYISVNVDHLQWTLTVQADIHPLHFMKKIRKNLSIIIFSNFGRIRRENLSECFWAPGDLVVLGNRPHPSNLINQFIRTIRAQQGITL